jgi:ComF family protein
MTFGLYEGVLADAIHQFKFYGLKRLSKPLGALLRCCDIQQVDGIVPVPLSANGLKTRGFNQSLLIARVIAKHSGIPVCMDTLFKQKDTLPQIGLSAKERRSNVRNAFVVKKKVEGLRLLLVDDVMTTGSTVTECAKQLRKAGAEEVMVLTLARAGLDK